MISIVVPTFNRPDLLQRSLASVRAQTLTDLELIVVNDSGTDVEAIARTYNAKYLALPQNRGLAGARNAGVQVASGDYVAFLDDDDMLLPTHLSQLSAASRPDTICYSDFWQVRQESRTEQRTPEFDYDRIMSENFIPVNCFLTPRQAVLTVGGFDEWLTALEDWDLWLRLSRTHRFQHVSGATCEVHIGRPGESITSSHPFGFTWASLNILYKNIQLFADRPDYVTTCAERTLAALHHLTALLVRQLQSATDTRAIFGRHDLATAATRLAALRELYQLHSSTFFEVEGYVQLLRSELLLAKQCFANAVSADPANQSAAAILQLLSAPR